jgi:hypothetical protein
LNSRKGHVGALQEPETEEAGGGLARLLRFNSRTISAMHLHCHRDAEFEVLTQFLAGFYMTSEFLVFCF